jgi:hypothetical protein
MSTRRSGRFHSGTSLPALQPIRLPSVQDHNEESERAAVIVYGLRLRSQLPDTEHSRLKRHRS